MITKTFLLITYRKPIGLAIRIMMHCTLMMVTVPDSTIARMELSTMGGVKLDFYLMQN